MNESEHVVGIYKTTRKGRIMFKKFLQTLAIRMNVQVDIIEFGFIRKRGIYVVEGLQKDIDKFIEFLEFVETDAIIWN
jgi:hypothetical protein